MCLALSTEDKEGERAVYVRDQDSAAVIKICL